jgi:hypothetical protein
MAQSLPADVQSTLLTAAQAGFVDAFTTGFIASAVLLGMAAVFAAFIVPGKVRAEQATGSVFEKVLAETPLALQAAEA